jgi:hypothetical protein
LLLVLTAATLTLKGFDHQLTTSGTGWGFAIVLIYGGVGLVVARRQPRNPIGWLLLIFIVLYVLGAGATEYAVLAYSLGHRGLPLAPVAVVLDTLQAPSLALFPPVILLFPDGRRGGGHRRPGDRRGRRSRRQPRHQWQPYGHVQSAWMGDCSRPCLDPGDLAVVRGPLGAQLAAGRRRAPPAAEVARQRRRDRGFLDPAGGPAKR